MSRMQLTTAALLAGLVSAPAMAANTAFGQYPTAESQIKDYFRQSPAVTGPNCGPGEIHDISDAQLISDTPQQLTMRVDYSFSAKALQNTNTCSGTQSAMVTFDKVDGGQLVINRMSGAAP